MDILIVQVFVSLLLVVAGVVLLAFSLKQADHEHADRLSILPLEDEVAPSTPIANEENARGATHHHV